jgi:hypothetical protein
MLYRACIAYQLLCYVQCNCESQRLHKCAVQTLLAHAVHAYCTSYIYIFRNA